MEGDSLLIGSRGGGSDLCTSQEPRQEEERGGAMRPRMCARVRTPHGVGAFLLVGGAIVGAALVAWRQTRRQGGKGAKSHTREQPVAKQVVDGGVTGEEQGGQSDRNLSSEDTNLGASESDGKATQDIHHIQEKDDIVADGLGGGPVEKFDDHSSKRCSEIIADDKDSGSVKKADEIPSKSGVEATEGVENSDQSALSISSPESTHEEQNEPNDGAQDTELTQISPTTQMDTVKETAEAEGTIAEKGQDEAKSMSESAELVESPAETEEGTITKKNVVEQGEHKPLVEPVELVGSRANSSLPFLLKRTEKKRPANTGCDESGMKLEQDYDSGELSNGVATKGVALVTMDRSRAAIMAIVALIFALTIGISIVVRSHSPFQAT